MSGLNKSQLLKRLAVASDVVGQEIRANAAGGKFAAGLASEGFAGGYMAALADVQALLLHGYPNDARGYWSRTPTPENPDD